MASRYIFTAGEAADVGDNSAYVGAASGGTLTGASATVELVFDDTVYGATLEGKQRLLAQIDRIRNRVSASKVWPITSAS